METKLTDFTEEEIIYALIQIQEGIDQAINAVAKHQFIGTDPEHERVKFWENQIEKGMKWKVQLMTAQTVVKDQETINQN